MVLDAWVYLLAAIGAIILMFAMIFFSILFADMEWDFVNPIDLCEQLNQYVLVEAAVHAGISFLLLVPMSWFLFIWNLPLLCWNGNKIKDNKMYYDSTEIFRLLKQHKAECYIKLGFYLFSFFFYLYRMIFSLVTTA